MCSPQTRAGTERCKTSGGQAVLRKTSRFRCSQSPGTSPGSRNVGSTSSRKSMRGSDREAGPKATKEKALERQKPRRARFGGRCRLRQRFSFPFLTGATSEVATIPTKAGAVKRQERRGPERGTAGREEQGLEGETPCALSCSTEQDQARRRANRREGNQTLRTKGVGVWKPRENRIRQAGMCCRGPNSMRAVSHPRVSRGQREGKGTLWPVTLWTSQAHDRRLRVLRRPQETTTGKTPGRPNLEGGAAEPNRRLPGVVAGWSAGQRL
jgi:hypothetical protein